jgi:hypothetical protein
MNYNSKIYSVVGLSVWTEIPVIDWVHYWDMTAADVTVFLMCLSYISDPVNLNPRSRIFNTIRAEWYEKRQTDVKARTL